MAEEALILGIDLGTTNCCAAVHRNELIVIPLEADAFTLPSVVGYLDSGEVITGQAARRQAGSNPTRTVIAAKRLIGRSFDDPDTQEAIKSLSFACTRGEQGDVRIAVGDRGLSCQEVSAVLLGVIKRAAEEHLGVEVKQAVVTVPAYFNDRQRTATKEAGEIAGLEVLQVLNEPTAAALAYGLDSGRERTVAVYDLGGGTFDVSILKVGDGIVEVLASDGNAFLGGHDFDYRIIEWLIAQIQAKDGIDLSSDVQALQRLRAAAEAAKVTLTDEPEARVAIPFLATNHHGMPVHVDCVLTRDLFEAMVQDLVEQTVAKFEATAEQAGLDGPKMDELVLVGGMTRMPAVRQRMQDLVGCEAAEGVHPDLVVAVGAAAHARGLAGGSGESTTTLLDVTPHNLGIEIVAGMSETIIPKNSKLPTEMKRMFNTANDDQTEVNIVVCQGNERKISQNEILGNFRLTGIPAARAGAAKVEVTFRISRDGIVEVAAKDVSSGRSEGLRIDKPVGLSADEMSEIMGVQHDPAAEVDG